MPPTLQQERAEALDAVTDERPLRILLIEDDPDDVLLLRDMLGDVPARFESENAESLADSLTRISQNQFDIALLDLFLPDSQGLETFLRLRESAPALPTVILTGMNDEAVGLEAMQHGAQDYLVKGHVDGPVLVRSIRFALERARRHEAERALCARQAEVTAAREIQQRLFPSAAPCVPGFDIAGASFPAIEVGGDFYDYVPMPNGQLALVIGDVTSHGLGPALMMAETRAYLRALMLTRSDVGQVLELANQALCMDTPDGRFVTVLLAGLDPAERTLVYASAGHPPGYVLDREGRIKHEMWSTGIPLGVESDATFPAARPEPLQPGDLVLLMTDGLLECLQQDGTRFGTPRVLDALRECRHRPAAEIVRALRDAVTHGQCAPQADDLTAMVVKVLE